MDDHKEEPDRLRLPDIMDLNAAEALRADLLARRGRPLALDGGDVQRLGGLCLQILLAARDGWRKDGQPFALVATSEGMDRALTLFGLSADELQASGV